MFILYKYKFRKRIEQWWLLFAMYLCDLETWYVLSVAEENYFAAISSDIYIIGRCLIV